MNQGVTENQTPEYDCIFADAINETLSKQCRKRGFPIPVRNEINPICPLSLNDIIYICQSWKVTNLQFF